MEEPGCIRSSWVRISWRNWGAVGRKILGTVVVAGMLAATGIAIFIIPLLFVVIERRAGKERTAQSHGGPSPAGERA